MRLSLLTKGARNTLLADNVVIGSFGRTTYARDDMRWKWSTDHTWGYCASRQECFAALKEIAPAIVERKREEEARAAAIDAMPIGIRILWDAWVEADQRRECIRAANVLDCEALHRAEEAFAGAKLSFLQGLLSSPETEECVAFSFARMANGYGYLHYQGRNTVASRVMCILAHGFPPSPTHEAAHSCGKGHEGCVNPRHLRWASPTENRADSRAHGTLVAGERSTLSKLTVSQVLAIRERVSRGVRGQAEIADDFGVSQQTVSDIAMGRSWAWLPCEEATP